MCVGIPMRVVTCHAGSAVCETGGETRLVDTMLVGDQPVGTWLLIFLDAAREVLSIEDAEKITAALQGLNQALSGGTDFDHLFADLIDREPQLPEHLRAKPAKKEIETGKN